MTPDAPLMTITPTDPLATTLKRAAIVGTAPSWRQTPWQDTGLDILGLNDGYMLEYRRSGQLALPRATCWFDLHPFRSMAFVPYTDKLRVDAATVPDGAYLRPAGHVEWLKARPHPVFLHTVPAGWPSHAQPFPRAALEEKYGSYFASTPAWMVVWAIEQGYQELHCYGIDLATEWEYVQQRPNFEFWLRHAMDRGIKLVLPTRCPLLKSRHVYAYEPKHDLPLQQETHRIERIKQEGAYLRQLLSRCSWYDWHRKADTRARLTVVDFELADAYHSHGRVRRALDAG